MNELGQKVRLRLIEALRRRFARAGTKRAEIRLILLATGIVGFLASFAMLHLGVEQMWLLYPLAALAGWLTFLVMVRLWAERNGSDYPRKARWTSLSPVLGIALSLRAKVRNGKAMEETGIGSGGSIRSSTSMTSEDVRWQRSWL